LALHLDRHGAVFNDLDDMNSSSQKPPRPLRIQMHAANFEPEFSGPAFYVPRLADEPRGRGHDVELRANWWPGLPGLAIGAPLDINAREMAEKRHSIRTIADQYDTLHAELLWLRAGQFERVDDLCDPRQSSSEVNP
jgi:hypothetical protein